MLKQTLWLETVQYSYAMQWRSGAEHFETFSLEMMLVNLTKIFKFKGQLL